MSSIDAQLFRNTLLEEIRAAWRTLRERHSTEHFYSFGFYTASGAEYLMVTFSTEEGLSTATEKYLARDGGDPTLMRTCLRWSVCDSPRHEEGMDLLPRSQALRDAGPDPYECSTESEEAITLVFDTAVDVLKALDSETIFGTEFERSRLILGIWMGDQSDEDRIAFARLLNPPHLASRFAKELEEGYQACRQLS